MLNTMDNVKSYLQCAKIKVSNNAKLKNCFLIDSMQFVKNCNILMYSNNPILLLCTPEQGAKKFKIQLLEELTIGLKSIFWRSLKLIFTNNKYLNQ